MNRSGDIRSLNEIIGTPRKLLENFQADFFKIKRYSKDGQVNLKEVGVLNTRKGSEEKLSLYPLNEDCVDEYILKLNRINEKNNLPLILSIIGGSLIFIVIVFLVIKKRYCNKRKNN